MLKRILLASLLGGLTVFIWGFLSWTVLPWHTVTMRNMPNEDAVVSQLKQLPGTGVYMFPAMPAAPDPKTQQGYEEKFSRGPIGYVFYTHPGTDAMRPQTFLLGFLFFCLSSFIAATLLSLAAPSIPGYSTRVFFVALLGIFTALESHMNAWNWLLYPAQYSITNALDVIAAWLLGGMVIAAMIKAPDAQTASSP